VAGGNGSLADVYTIASGIVNFTDHDTFGNAAANPALTINVNGAVLSNEAAAFGMAFTTVGLLNLNGGTVTSTGGANANFQAFQFKNTVTSTGSSVINTTSTPAAFNGFHVTNNIFNVTSGTLTVSAPLINAGGGGAAGFTKSGAGTMTLSAVNGFTGSLLVNGGTLNVAAGGSVTGISKLNTQAGGTLVIDGTVSMAANGNFDIGGGLTGTTGFLTVNNGGVLTIGTGASGIVGYTGIGGSDSGSGGQKGMGTLTINTGGVVNVAAGGAGAGGLDGSSLWINPYGQTGPSGIHLNGGTLSTARPVQDGSGGGVAFFNFNGGTLKAAAAINLISLNSNVRNGGAILDSNGLSASVSGALVHSPLGGDNAIDGGLTKTGDGTITLTSNGSTYTGNVVISQGILALQTGLNGPAPGGTGLGNPNVAGRTVTVGSGATLQFRQHDQLGNDVANPQMTIVVNGGTLAAATGSQASGNGPFNTLPTVTLNGGTLTSANGAFPAVQSFNLKGDILVTGSTPSTINTTGTPALLNGIHLSKAGGVNFNVSDVAAGVDLTVSAPLIAGAVGGANAGPGVLIKSGPGTMALTTTNTYTGNTTVQAGTLALSGTGSVASGLIDVTSGGTFDVSAISFTLGGTQTLKANGLVTGVVTTALGSVVTGSGTIDGDLLIGGNLAPGNSPGTLTLTNDNLVLGSASTGTFELGGTAPSAYDRVVGINSLTLDGIITVSYTGGFNPTTGNSFDLFDFTTVNASGFNVATDLVLPALDSNLSWDTSAFTTSGVIAVVPEPSITLLGSLTLLGLLRRRRA
jgi:autotransporter-associated beta strand protein